MYLAIVYTFAVTIMKNYSYLALGDSYTIGEQVPFADNFPNQAVQILRRKGFDCHAPEIIAKTGWTGDELIMALDATVTLEQYDMVTLLVGVNNQYRGRSLDEFGIQFDSLLQRAIHLAGDKPGRVVVISIPDWGVTPFAKQRLPDTQGRSQQSVATDIDLFNNTCHRLATNYGTQFLYITSSQRVDGHSVEYLAPDELHPSGKEYEKWAELVADIFMKALEEDN